MPHVGVGWSKGRGYDCLCGLHRSAQDRRACSEEGQRVRVMGCRFGNTERVKLHFGNQSPEGFEDEEGWPSLAWARGNENECEKALSGNPWACFLPWRFTKLHFQRRGSDKP